MLFKLNSRDSNNNVSYTTKSNLNKAKEKFYQSITVAEMSVRQAIELSLKEKNKDNLNNAKSTNSDNMHKVN